MKSRIIATEEYTTVKLCSVCSATKSSAVKDQSGQKSEFGIGCPGFAIPNIEACSVSGLLVSGSGILFVTGGIMPMEEEKSCATKKS